MLIIRKIYDEYRTDVLYISRPKNITPYMKTIKKRMNIEEGGFAEKLSQKIINLVCFKGTNLNDEYNLLYSTEIDSFEKYLYKIKLLDKNTILKLIKHSRENNIFEIKIAKVESYSEENLFSTETNLVENLNKGLEDINDKN